MGRQRSCCICSRFQAKRDMLGKAVLYPIFTGTAEQSEFPQKSQRSHMDEADWPHRPCTCRIFRYIRLFHAPWHSRHQRNVHGGKFRRTGSGLLYPLDIAETELCGSTVHTGKISAEKSAEGCSVFRKIHEWPQRRYAQTGGGVLYPCPEHSWSCLCTYTHYDRFFP